MFTLNSVLRRFGRFFLIYTLIVVCSLALIRLPVFNNNPNLVLATLFDLTIFPIILFYLIVARPLGISYFQLILTFCLITRIAFFIIPFPDSFPYVSLPVILILFEGVTVAMILYRSRQIVTRYRQFRISQDADTALLNSLTKVLGENFAQIIMAELRLITYGLFGWLIKTDIVYPQKALTSYKKSGSTALLVTIISAGLIETAAVHILIAQWSQTTAFWVTGLSLYSILFIVAEIVAMYKRASYISSESLNLRLGIRWHGVIPLSAIKDIISIQKKPVKSPDVLNGSLIVAPNTLIVLKRPVKISGLYSIKREVTSVTIFLDHSEDLLLRINL